MKIRVITFLAATILGLCLVAFAHHGTNASYDSSQTITLKGNLRRTSDKAGLLGMTLTFKVDGTVVGTAVTIASGSAWLGYKIPTTMSVGPHTLTVAYAGDSKVNASSGTGTLTVN